MAKFSIKPKTPIQKYIFYLVVLSTLIGIFSITTYVILFKLLDIQKRNFKLINASEKYRVLSQRSGLISSQLLHHLHKENSIELTNSLNQTAKDLQKSHIYIMDHFEDLSNNSSPKLLEILDHNVQMLLRNIHLVTTGKNSLKIREKSLNIILNLVESKIPKQLKKTVHVFEEVVHNDTFYIQIILTALISCILASILIGAINIFYPMIKHIREERIKLKSSYSKLNAIITGAVNGIITINKKGIIETINPGGEKMFLYSANDLIGRNISFLMPQPYKREHDSYINNYLETRKPKIIGIGREVVGLRKDGTKFPMFLSVSESMIKNKIFFTGFVQDITKLKSAQEEIQNLSLAIIKIQEEERDRISREIHDDLGTSIALVKMLIQSSYVKIKKRYNISNQNTEPECDEVIDYLNSISETARQMSHTLSPVGMKGLGLCTAIEKLVAKIVNNSNIKVKTNLEQLNSFFPDNWDINLYRIIQESLLNIHKHAKASIAYITAEKINDKKITLIIKDDGKGINTSMLNQGLGMSLMKQRAQLMNATINITSRRGQGTEIKLELNK